MNVFDLFASLSLDKSGYESELNSAEAQGKETSINIGETMKKVAKATVAGITAAAGAVGLLVKQSTAAYADYEQLVGGVETLFGTSAKSLQEYAAMEGKNADKVLKKYNQLKIGQATVMANAANAYKTAGLSANEYMETVTSFAAALNNSLNGNTAESARKADMAITDMADNANKMGTSMEAIQNAYNGFAKQNYTMLDNLKLGFGGTKEEMQRLLDTATKMSGVKYDISSYADIVDAIHVVQSEMGITGTTAKEAAETISGSLASTKAAWQNLLTGLADEDADMDTLINNLVESATNFGGNIIPRIRQGIDGVGQLIESALPIVMGEIPVIINDFLPQFLEAGKNMIYTIINGVTSNTGEIVSGIIEVGMQLIDAIFELTPQLLQAGFQIIATITRGLLDNFPMIVGKISDFMAQAADYIRNNLPVILETVVGLIKRISVSLAHHAPILLEAGIDLLMALAEGLIEALPMLIEQIPVIIDTLANIINDNAPRIIEAGFQILVALGKGIIQAVPTLIANIPMILKTIVDVWSAFNWLQLGGNVITGIKNGITGAIGLVKQAGSSIGNAIVEAVKHLPQTLAKLGSGSITGFINSIKNLIPELGQQALRMGLVILQKLESFSLFDVGKNLIKGLINGIAAMAGELLSYVGGIMTNVISTVTGIFDQHSPSKVFDKIGRNNVLGFERGMNTLDPAAMASKFNDVVDAVGTVEPSKAGAAGGTPAKQTTTVVVRLEGDAKRMFRLMQAQAIEEEELTGLPAF